MKRILLLILALLPVASDAGAQAASAVYDRGLKPENLYHFGDIDNVALFNGNLTAAIPVGPKFTTDGGLSYQLTLSYNSTFWDWDISTTFIHAIPWRASNAGMGWSLHMGQFYAGNKSLSSNYGGYSYVGPDGAEHTFDKRPATNGTLPPINYTTDGTNLRVQAGATTSLVEFPDGTVHAFEKNATTGLWELREMRAPGRVGSAGFNPQPTVHVRTVTFPNALNACNAAGNAWSIYDGRRQHYVCFEKWTMDDEQRELVSRVVLNDGGGAARQLTYEFHYETVEVPRPVGEVDGTSQPPWRMTHKVTFLKSVTQPDQSTWEFSRLANSVDLSAITLPTKGRIEYTYAGIPLPGPANRCPGPYPEAPDFQTSPMGVATRTIIPAASPGGTAPAGAVWTYERRALPEPWYQMESSAARDCMAPLSLPDLMRVRVTDPAGLRTDSYFSIWEGARYGYDATSPGKIRDEHYALPWGRFDAVKQMYLSQEEYDCSNSACTKLRTTYVVHDIEPNSFRDTHPVPRNPVHRLKKKHVVHHDDCVDGVCRETTTDNEDWDGYGHYRTQKSSYDAGKGEVTRTVTTNWNENRTIGDGHRWVTGVYDTIRTTETEVDEDGDPTGRTLETVERACFQSDAKGHDGFVRAKRLQAGPSAGATDVIAAYELGPDWNVAGERSYGGDDDLDPQTPSRAVPVIDDLCTALASLTNPLYTIQHTWQNGVLAQSKHDGANFFSLDLTVDKYGVVTDARDAAGETTGYTYEDGTGRIKTITPAVGSATSYSYVNAAASSTDPLRLVTAASITQTTPATGGKLETQYEFDSMGRIAVERKLLPSASSNVYSRREHTHDALGRKVATSVWGTDASLKASTFEYDVLGRTTKVTAPDRSSVSYAYSPASQKQRTSKFWNGSGDAESVTEEHTDGFGRLVAVEEASAPDGSVVTTRYAYGAGDRLRLVSTTAGGKTQQRTFTYDGRGFLTAEQHPESGKTSYRYDARGHLILKQAADAKFNLALTYDAAERLTRVADASGRTLKAFTFHSTDGTGERNKGKLWQAIRHNYPVSSAISTLNVSRDAVVVTESYTYPFTQSGRRVKRETKIEQSGKAPIEFTQSTEFNEISLPALVSYPVCVGCALPPRASVKTTYQNGRVLSVGSGAEGAAPDVTYLEYTGDGSWQRRRHGNKIVDVRLPDPTGMPRPQSIGVELPSSCSLITRQPEDLKITSGSPATFSVSGPESATYTWYQGLTGDTRLPLKEESATLTVNVTSPSAMYWCRVRTATCVEDSRTATVCVLPNIIRPTAPVAPLQTVTVGTTVALSAETTDIAASYTWFKKSGDSGAPVKIDGTAPSNTYVVTSDDASPLILFVRVANSCGVAEREVARLHIDRSSTVLPCVAAFEPALFDLYTPINPNEQTPLDVGVKLQDDQQGTIHAKYPTRVYNFRWIHEGVQSQQNEVTLTGTTVESARSRYNLAFTGQTWVRVEGWITCSNTAENLTITSPTITSRAYGVQWGHCPVPEITSVTPGNIVIASGDTATFVADVPYPHATYQWYEGESGNTRGSISGATTRELRVTKAGSYWLRVSTDCGTHTDGPTVTVSTAECTPVRITSEPQDVWVDAGTRVPLSVTATGKPLPHKYTWTNGFESYELPARTKDQSSIVTDPVVRTSDFAVRIENSCSTARSRVIRVHVISCAEIRTLEQPRDESVPEWSDASKTSRQPVTLRVSATSVAQIRYTWYKGESGDTRDPVGTGPTLYLPTPESGKYWVRLSLDSCEVDSRTVTVSVCREPEIVNLLGAEYVNALPGVNRELAIGVKRPAETTFTWYEGTVGDRSKPFPTKANAIRVWPRVTTSYWVEVTAKCVAPETDRVRQFQTRISVCPAFNGGITAGKTIVMPNTTTTLTVSTDRAESVRWFIKAADGTVTEAKDANGNPLIGNSVTTGPIAQKTTFFARAISGTCPIDSTPITIDVCQPIGVQWTNGSRQAEADQQQFLTASVSAGDAPVTMLWYKGNTVGDTVNAVMVHQYSNTYEVHPTETTSYWVRVGKSESGCYSDSSLFTVNVCVPKILTQPQSTTINSGATATLTVGVDLPGMQYQWYIGQPGDTANPIAGQTGSTLTVSPAAETTYWVRVTGCTGAGLTPVTRDSAAATVSICRPAAIASQPASGWLTKGATRELSVSAEGTEPLTYQWYRGVKGDTANAIASASSISVTPQNTTSYWARVTNRCGSADTDTVTISVCAPPSMTAQPASQTIFSGTSATLSVTATQETSTAMTYQWYRGSGTATPIAGATSSTYTTPPLTAATSYWVRVTAGTCVTDSALATISMCPYAQTVNAPDDRDIAVGGTTRLSVTLSPVPEQVRWYRGVQGDRTNVISSAHSVDVSPTATTQYWGEFTHSGCTMKSRTVTVHVSIPTIRQQPASVQVNNGQTATLSVVADTTGLTYQWYSGASGSGTAITGATSSSYTTPPMSVTTSYWVKVTGSRGHSVNSDTATVTVCVPASISQQPQSASIRRGSSTSLSVSAGGTNLRYQWYRATAPNELNPFNTASSVSVSPTDPTSYWVKVTSDCGAVNSATATVDVCVDPTISGPSSRTIYSGTSTTLTVTATAGTSLPLSYQWYSGTSGSGTPISGATSASYTTPALTSAANYWVKVTSGVCAVNSSTAAVSICPYNPTIDAPADYDIAVGQTARLSVTLSPVPDSGRWFRGAQGNMTDPISAYTFADVSPTVTTQYWGEFTKGSCTTKTRTVTVWVSIPTLTQQPAASTQVNGGQSATLSVAANTTGLTYQWYSGTSGTGTPISGATGPTYVTPALAGGSAASYWVKVTGSRGHAVNSNTASVTWCLPASITQHPASRSIRQGSSVSLRVEATGTNLRYQWYRATSPNEANPAGTNSSQYDVVPTDTTNYWVKVISDCGAANSTTARVEVCLDPTINTQPSSPTVNSGSSATLSVVATANTTLPLSYQWYSGTSGTGTPIAGATGSTYTTPALSAAASYWVKVTSGVCSTNSATSTVSICPYPATLSSPSDRRSKAGQTNLLSISLSPTPQQYAWYRGVQGDRSMLLSNAPSFNVYPTVTTQYWGEFTNNGCVTKSRTFTIDVCIPTITAQPQSQSVAYGTSATLSVGATEAVSYQWFLGSTGQPIANATSATYTTPALYADESYWVEATGSCGATVQSGWVYATIAW